MPRESSRVQAAVHIVLMMPAVKVDAISCFSVTIILHLLAGQDATAATVGCAVANDTVYDTQHVPTQYTLWEPGYRREAFRRTVKAVSAAAAAGAPPHRPLLHTYISLGAGLKRSVAEFKSGVSTGRS